MKVPDARGLLSRRDGSLQYADTSDDLNEEVKATTMPAPQHSTEAQPPDPPVAPDAPRVDEDGAREQDRVPQARDSRSGKAPTADADHADAVAKARQRLSELEAALQRERADFLNYRRRATQERDESGQTARIGVYRLLLPILDDLELAIQHSPAPGGQEPWVEGYRLVARKLMQVLEHAGVARIGVVGEAFDPHVHEAVGQRPPAHSDERPGTVGEVVRPGYRLQEHILRPAQVIVIGDVGRQSAETGGT